MKEKYDGILGNEEHFYHRNEIHIPAKAANGLLNAVNVCHYIDKCIPHMSTPEHLWTSQSQADKRIRGLINQLKAYHFLSSSIMHSCSHKYYERYATYTDAINSTEDSDTIITF